MSVQPEKIGPYRIVETLGQGGMGIVYKGCHAESGRYVALKAVRFPRQSFLQTIRREISVLARIQHPGIVEIVDYDMSGGRPWYAMELIEGVSFRSFYKQLTQTGSDDVNDSGTASFSNIDTLSKADLSESFHWTQSLEQPDISSIIVSETRQLRHTPDSCGKKSISHTGSGGKTNLLTSEAHFALLTIFRRLCGPLSYLHGEGIVYRDLKPDNIIIRPNGIPVIVDFGLFSNFGGIISRETLHVISRTAGTIHYIAPEQIRGEYVDARADLYSLGCLLYEFFAGFFPFSGNSVSSIINAHLYDSPPPLTKCASYLPDDLSVLIHQLLAKEPRQRLGYADTVAHILGGLGAGNGSAHTFPLTRSYLYRPGFTGRNRQLAQLGENLDRLMKNEGSVIFIEGESGVGKTRLAMEFGRMVALQGGTVLTGECHENTIQSLQALRKPMVAIADLCREKGTEFTHHLFENRLSVLATHIPELSDLLGQDISEKPVELPAQQAQMRLFSYLWETLCNLSKEDPLLIILDDIQWADETTIGFIEFVLRSGYINDNKVLILGTCRSEETTESIRGLYDHQNLEIIQLSGMSESNISELIKDMLSLARSPDVFCQFLIDQTEGNPLFVAEYLKTMVDNNMLHRDDRGEWSFRSPDKDDQGVELANVLARSLPLPGSIKNLLSRRMQLLDQNETRVLHCVAALGREVSIAFLSHIIKLSEADLWTVLAALFKRQILEESTPESVRFVHSTIRKVAYELISEKARCILHRTIAIGIEAMSTEPGKEYLGERAFHWNKAGEYQKARVYYIQAAENALKFSRYSEVVEYAREAKKIEAGNDARKLLADALYGQSRFEETLEEINAIREDINTTPQERAAARLLEAWVYESYGDYEKSLQITDEILKVETDTLSRYEILRLQGVLTYFLGRNEESLVILRGLKSQLEQKDRITLNGREFQILSATLGNIGVILDSTGHSQEALVFLNEALDLSETHGDRSVIAAMSVNLGNLYYSLGNYEKAYTFYGQSKKLHHEIGDRRGFAASLNSIGAVNVMQREYRQSLRVREEALTIFREVGDQIGVGACLNNMGTTLYFMGDYEKSFSILNDCLNISEQTGDRCGSAIAMKNLGVLFKFRAEFDNALTYLDRALSIFQKTEYKKLEAETLLSIGSVCFLLSRFQDAEKFFQQSLQLSRAGNMKDVEADTLIKRARTRLDCMTEKADEDIHRATEIVKSMNYVHLEPEIKALQARLYSLRGNHEQALKSMASLEGIMANTEDFQLLLELRLDDATIHLAAGNLLSAEKSAWEGAVKARKNDSRLALQQFEKIIADLGRTPLI